MNDFFDDPPRGGHSRQGHGSDDADGDPGFWGEKRSWRRGRGGGGDADGAREQRRAAARRHARRQRRVVLLLVAAVALALLAGFVVIPMVRGDDASDVAGAEVRTGAATGTAGTDAEAVGSGASRAAGGGAAGSAAAVASPSTSRSDSTSPPPAPATPTPRPPTPTYSEPPAPPAPTPTPTVVPKPAIVNDYVPYGSARRRQMAAYCRRHYGAAQATWVLKPKAVVLHYTAGGSYSSAHNYFSSNAPALGELPGVCSHFIIDKNGKIYQQLPLGLRCRHTIGLNYTAVGIEFVQEAGSGPTWATNQIFNRTKQINAGLRLVRWLKWKYTMPMKNILGHGTANASPLFRDLKGWRNDHVDWGVASVARFKKKLATIK